MTVRETAGGLLGLGAFALVLTTIGNGVWGGLLATNLRTSPRVPWSVPVMAALLWVAWSYLSGARGDSRKSALRRRRLRARAVSPRVLQWAAVAGMVSIVSLAGLWIVLAQLMPVKGNVLPDFSRYPVLVVVLIIIMPSFTGAAFEEAGFRGYFQVVVFFSVIWPFDAGRRIMGSEGPDAWFWIHVVQALVGMMLSMLAFRRLALITTRCGL